MEYFTKFTSNSAAAAGNQSFFTPDDENALLTSRAFFRISAGGKFNYSLLFSNITDSTFADGSHSRCNLGLWEWYIASLRVAPCNTCGVEKMPESSDFAGDFITLTFDGSKHKTVKSGEFFSTDAVELAFSAGQYMCVEITYRGRQIPCHPETLLPVFAKRGDEWVYDVDMPLPCMIGCDRPVKKRIAFLGDSITQGCGTPKNGYMNYAALVAKRFENEYACWNLGIGYGRGADAATDGAWLYKAKQNDIVTVCYGVNDIFQLHDAECTKSDLTKIVRSLKAAGVKVVLQAVPPFDYCDADAALWRDINGYVYSSLAAEADAFLDTPPFLSSPHNPQMTIYGGHPNTDGCAVWAEKLIPVIENVLNK